MSLTVSDPQALTALSERTARDRPVAPLCVIILTFNEEVNLPDCLRSLCPLNANAEIIVLDSGSTDRTIALAEAAGARVFHHGFHNYGAQRNWALDNLHIRSEWILCLDADERLTPDVAKEILSVIGTTDTCSDGYLLCKRTIFMGRWIRHGGQYPSYHLRLFRRGAARCEEQLYDQHFVTEGNVGKLKHDYLDVLTTNLSTWVQRHDRWSTLEAADLVRRRRGGPEGPSLRPKLFGTTLERKRWLRRRVYQRAPRLLRAFVYWFYAYFLRLGFLDGTEGLVFHTLRLFWFRFLVDAKTIEAERWQRPLVSPE